MGLRSPSILLKVTSSLLGGVDQEYLRLSSTLDANYCSKDKLILSIGLKNLLC